MKISEEVKEIFDDPDFGFGSILRVLATELGGDITLKEVNEIYQASRPLPTREINGETFVAGYRGPNIMPEGTHINAKLVDIKQSGEKCKLLFVFPSSQFLYFSLPKDNLRVEGIVSLAKKLNQNFTAKVQHEIIPATGEKHAVVVEIQE